MNQPENPKKKSDVIKTSYELAMEKLQNEDIPGIPLQDIESRTEGRKLAAAYLRNEPISITHTIETYPENQRVHVIQGAIEIFLFNITLPNSKKSKLDSDHALEGLATLLSSNQHVLTLCGELATTLDEFFKKQTYYYNQLKEEFAGKASLMEKQVKAQLGSTRKISPDQLPEFKKKWKLLLKNLQEQFDIVVNDLKNKLKNVM